MLYIGSLIDITNKFQCIHLIRPFFSFPGNRTHYLGIAKNMRYRVSNAFNLISNKFQDIRWIKLWFAWESNPWPWCYRDSSLFKDILNRLSKLTNFMFFHLPGSLQHAEAQGVCRFKDGPPSCTVHHQQKNRWLCLWGGQHCCGLVLASWGWSPALSFMRLSLQASASWASSLILLPPSQHRIPEFQRPHDLIHVCLFAKKYRRCNLSSWCGTQHFNNS